MGVPPQLFLLFYAIFGERFSGDISRAPSEPYGGAMQFRLPFCLLVLNLSIAQCAWSQKIDPASVTSLKLTILRDNVEIGSATGFVMAKGSKHYLVTNRHVVLACALDGNSNNVGGWICANRISILHNRLNRLGEWIPVTEDLYEPPDKCEQQGKK